MLAVNITSSERKVEQHDALFRIEIEEMMMTKSTGASGRAGGPADLSQSPLSQPKALIPDALCRCASDLIDAEGMCWGCGKMIFTERSK